jgi:hypothetical protein
MERSRMNTTTDNRHDDLTALLNSGAGVLQLCPVCGSDELAILELVKRVTRATVYRTPDGKARTSWTGLRSEVLDGTEKTIGVQCLVCVFVHEGDDWQDQLVTIWRGPHVVLEADIMRAYLTGEDGYTRPELDLLFPERLLHTLQPLLPNPESEAPADAWRLDDVVRVDLVIEETGETGDVDAFRVLVGLVNGVMVASPLLKARMLEVSGLARDGVDVVIMALTRLVGIAETVVKEAQAADWS